MNSERSSGNLKPLSSIQSMESIGEIVQIVTNMVISTIAPVAPPEMVSNALRRQCIVNFSSEILNKVLSLPVIIGMLLRTTSLAALRLPICISQSTFRSDLASRLIIWNIFWVSRIQILREVVPRPNTLNVPTLTGVLWSKTPIFQGCPTLGFLREPKCM